MCVIVVFFVLFCLLFVQIRKNSAIFVCKKFLLVMAYLLSKDGIDHYGVVKSETNGKFSTEEIEKLLGINNQYFKLVGIPMRKTEEYLPLFSTEKGMKCDYLVFSVLKDEYAKMYCNDHIHEHKKEYNKIHKAIGLYKMEEVSMLKYCLEKEEVNFTGDYPTNITYCYAVSASPQQFGVYCLPFRDFKHKILGSCLFVNKEEFEPTLIRDEETELASIEWALMLKNSKCYTQSEEWCKANAKTDYTKWLKKFVPYKWSD